MKLHILATIILLIWAGMILGISCLEAWAKFRAPSLSKAAGLDVGRTVFAIFHKVQWVLLIILTLTLYFISISYLIIPFGISILLTLQTFWIFRHLAKDVELIIAGNQLPKSHFHKVYAVVELSKLILLITSSLSIIMA